MSCVAGPTFEALTFHIGNDPSELGGELLVMSESEAQGESVAESGSNLDSRLRAALKSRARDLEPCLRFGKRGIPEESVAWLLERFETTDLLKVRFEKSIAPIAEDLAMELAQSLKAELVQYLGRVAVLYRPVVETAYTKQSSPSANAAASNAMKPGVAKASAKKKRPAPASRALIREVPKK